MRRESYGYFGEAVTITINAKTALLWDNMLSLYFHCAFAEHAMASTSGSMVKLRNQDNKNINTLNARENNFSLQAGMEYEKVSAVS